MKIQPTELEKLFAKETTDKGLIFKIYKHLMKLNSKQTNNPIKNRKNIYTDNSPKKTFRWQKKKHIKRYSTSLIIRQMQIKSTKRYHITPARMAIIKKSSKSK